MLRHFFESDVFAGPPRVCWPVASPSSRMQNRPRQERVIALGKCRRPWLFVETDFKKKCTAHLTGERGWYPGWRIQDYLLRSMKFLRKKGHLPQKHKNSSRRATQSLHALGGREWNGLEYAKCSLRTRGSIDWWKRSAMLLAGITELYDALLRLRIQRSIDSNGHRDYREKLESRIKRVARSEMWQGQGKRWVSLRPENQKSLLWKKY